MTEPDVTLTDYALTLECVIFIFLLCRSDRESQWRLWFVLLFGSVAAASLFGGTVHGFFHNNQSLGARILWPMTMLATGVTTLADWAIGAKLLFSKRTAGWMIVAAIVGFVIYSLTVLFWSQKFMIAIANNLPAVIFLMIAFIVAYRRLQNRNLLMAAGGLMLSIVAGVLQQLGVAIHPVYCSHNTLYHALQAISLWLIFLGGRWLISDSEQLRAGC